MQLVVLLLVMAVGALSFENRSVARLSCAASPAATVLPKFGEKNIAVAPPRALGRAGDTALLFVHIFKAAGSSVRTLLRRYAEKCGRRWACLVMCSEGGLPRNGVVPCRMRDTVNIPREAVMDADYRQKHSRQQGARRMRRDPASSHLGEYADVVGGHFHFGLHSIFAQRGRPYTYFTVLREPFATWISGVRYHEKGLRTVAEIIAALKASLPARGDAGMLRKRAFANAINYLVEAPRLKGASAADKLSSARSNLAMMDVVGLVESWPTTIDLLAATLDAGDTAASLWERNRKVATNTASKSLGFNSRDIAAAVRADRDGLWGDVVAFLSSENALYEDALLSHARSCSALLDSRCRLRKDGGLATLLNASFLAPELLDPSRFRRAHLHNAPSM